VGCVVGCVVELAMQTTEAAKGLVASRLFREMQSTTGRRIALLEIVHAVKERGHFKGIRFGLLNQVI
jgi:hypothetical protein